MATKVALLGAGGKMGARITKNIRDLAEYDVSYVEVSEAGRASMAERGINATDEAEAVRDADIVVLAVPDALIGSICKRLVEMLKSGAMVMLLDPAAPHAGVLPPRDDVSYFVTHPSHPPLFGDETTSEAQTDWFGGTYAKQNVVCALHSGPDQNYARGEALAKAMFAPVLRVHRLTTEQMALLEPALAESLAASCVTVIKQGMDEVVRLGVPEDAAWDFLSGHLRVEIAALFGVAGIKFSDGANAAIARAIKDIFQPDWKEKLFNLENVKKSVREIADAR